MKISKFTINGLFGDRRVVLPTEQQALILVGPNGLGKSSVANIFYFTVSRQWQRLSDYKFDSIEIVTGTETIILRRDDLSGLQNLTHLMEGTTSRTGEMIKRLMASDDLDGFIRASSLSMADRRKYAAVMNMQISEVPLFQRHLQRQIGPEDLFGAPRTRLEGQLSQAVTSRVLFLPTYRRIERDMREIFPGFEERFRRVGGSENRLEAGRSGNFYIELVNFGMEDVKKNIEEIMQSLRQYSLTQYNNLSASYLRDVIRGKADKYNARDLASLDDKGITAILDRVSETALSIEDKELLRKRIRVIQGQTKTVTEPQDRYLAHYFSRLLSITNDIVRRESAVTAFISVCNAYLKPSKAFEYDEVSSSIKVLDDRGKELDLSLLSSGEKQIVSVFSHLYLDENKKQIIIIDEPELSLSVPWQRRFLLDIIETGKCDFLLAVTHSPFVYDNDLKTCTVDLRKLTTRVS